MMAKDPPRHFPVCKLSCAREPQHAQRRRVGNTGAKRRQNTTLLGPLRPLLSNVLSRRHRCARGDSAGASVGRGSAGGFHLAATGANLGFVCPNSPLRGLIAPVYRGTRRSPDLGRTSDVAENSAIPAVLLGRYIVRYTGVEGACGKSLMSRAATSRSRSRRNRFRR